MEMYLKVLELNARFAWLIDHEDGQGVENLFVIDGVYSLGPMQAVGREQIKKFYQMRKARGLRQSRHIFSNPVIIDQTENHVKASSILTLFAFDGEGPHPSEIHMVADYIDEYVRDEDGIWRYQSRDIKPVFGNVPNLTEKQ